MFVIIKKTNYFSMILAFLMILSFSVFPKVYADPIEVTADGAVLMDELTGEILYNKNKDQQFPPASTTKIITALLVLENANLDDIVTISKDCEPIEGSKIYIFEDEKLTVRDLLHALIKVSANDAAIALAEHVSGTTDEFAKLMTSRAKELGCTNSSFKNPHGLYEEGHVTTANDLALIMKALMANPHIKDISSTYFYEIQPTNKCADVRPLWNQNYLLYPENPMYYKYAEAGKTGYTDESLHSYVASAKKEETRLILAFLHDSKKSFFADAKNLFDYGFDNFQVIKAVEKNQLIADFLLPDGSTIIPLLAKDDLYIIKDLKSDKVISDITFDNSTVSFTDTSVAKGTTVSFATISYNDISYNIDLINNIEYTPPLKTTTRILNNFSSINFFKILFIVLLLLILILMLIIIFKVKSERRKRRLMRKYNVHISSPNLYRSKTLRKK
ncbi:MAG: D-alanyl-D-alanine carboxypeptidase family protein [Clostridium sp.]